jgi:hypothetical protein
MSKRHMSDESLKSQLENNKRILVNIYCRQSGLEWDTETVCKAETDSSIIDGWLIASVQQVF